MSKTIRQRIGESAADAAVMCFRKGLTSAEEDMKPDKELIADMHDAKIRVQDLVEVVYKLSWGCQEADDRVVNFCVKRCLGE